MRSKTLYTLLLLISAAAQPALAQDAPAQPQGPEKLVIPAPINTMQAARDAGLKPLISATLVPVKERCEDTELYKRLASSWLISLGAGIGGLGLGLYLGKRRAARAP